MSKNEIFNVKNLVRLALVAAMYVALTLLIEPFSYGIINFRFSEVLMLLCFYRKDYGVALTMGCFIANIFSPNGLDIILGTLGTAAAAFLMYYMKNVYLAALLPVLTNAILVGIELHIYGEPLWFSIGSVALGELCVMVIGLVVFKALFERSFMLKLIGCTKEIHKKKETIDT